MTTSNFLFLQKQWPEIARRAIEAEKTVITDPRASLAFSRMVLEQAINWMYTNDKELELPNDTTLNSLMKQECFRIQFNHKLYRDIDLIRKRGNLAIHNKKVDEFDAEKCIQNLFYFSKWLAKSYSNSEIEVHTFDFYLIPKQGEAALSRNQLDKLQNQLDSDLKSYQTNLKKIQEEALEKQKENDLLKLQLQKLQQQIKEQKAEANQIDSVQHPRNEMETRRDFIDVSLREAGWDLQGVNDKEFEVKHMPLSTNPSGLGYADYVLWDDNGKPLAVIEAKKSMESASKGENQAQLYADALQKMYDQRPVMFYTNGFETYLWDDCFYKQSRQVHGFYTKAELQTIIYRRTNRKDIRTQQIDTEIVERPYQLRSIRSIAEHYAGNCKQTGKLIGTNRGALLVLATGTGKTRTAIALSKIMFQAYWAKRILFLADRISLVSQAKRNFTKFLPNHSAVNLLDEKEKKNSRLVFSTYKTMMNLIDGKRNGEERFYGIGHFDLIIVDEAHRSIYNKYQALFQYFDALYLGLTATPKDAVDKNTYEAFGLVDKSPTDDYSFDEAVENGHLTPYHSIEVPTKFHTQGIKYDELSDEEKEEFEKEILEGQEATGSERVDKSALDNWLFNEDTAIKTLRYFLKHAIKIKGGDEIGKTIVFARNKRHAHFLKDIFLKLDKEQFGNDYVKVIVNKEPKAEEFLLRFCDDEQDRLPQIAISVDMMDTGIDAPKVVNLIFYKPVKSYAKFWQMIGRGSRLSPNLFGPDQHKDKFLIFDLCENFEFFRENPEGIESNPQQTLSQNLFALKLQIAQSLKDKKYKDNQELQQFRTNLLDDLHGQVAKMDQTRFDVKMNIKTVLDFGNENRQKWNHLNSADILRIKDEIIPLVQPQKGEDELARYYDRLIYNLMEKRIQTPNTEKFTSSAENQISRVMLISGKLLEKTSIPQVKEKEQLIEKNMDEEFWKNKGVSHLEKIRDNIRTLIRYIDKTDQKYVTTNFTDTILTGKIKTDQPFEQASDSPQEYIRSQVFSNNIHRLEDIVRTNQNHVTINRIKNQQPISNQELVELEKFLFAKPADKERLEKELGREINLTTFIKNLVGLSQECVNSAFAQFTNQYQLSSKQIHFLDTIKQFLTKNGKINPEMLYEAPFTEIHIMGIDGVFNDNQTDQIIDIIQSFTNEQQISS